MTRSTCVWYWFIFLPYKFLLDNILLIVNKTSRDKCGASANEKWKRCNRIPSNRTLGRNDPSVGYN